MLRRSSAFQSAPTASNSWENRLRRRLSAYMRKGPQPAQRAKLFMRFYPPLFFQRVVPLYIAPDYSVAHIKVKRSLLTINLNGSFSFSTNTPIALSEAFPSSIFFRVFRQSFRRISRKSL